MSIEVERSLGKTAYETRAIYNNPENFFDTLREFNLNISISIPYPDHYSYSKKEKDFLLNNTFAKVQIIDPVRGNDIFCGGKIAEELN